ncbi:MAG TPA: V-type ATP synthase subunit D, partial [Spirochaetota bacterium]|nr:V-type ATP synthase subunit D [Spirochaetota bacterium]
MAMKIQFNKTFLQYVKKQLSIREKALPTLKAKEAALRLEVKKAKKELTAIKTEFEKMMQQLKPTYRMWREFPHILELESVDTSIKSLAGVKMPLLKQINFKELPYSYITEKEWISEGKEILKKLLELKIKRHLAEQRMQILEYARKKTTQEVNLYEKVQIPEFNNSLLKIKRFLEDKENLAKSS